MDGVLVAPAWDGVAVEQPASRPPASARIRQKKAKLRRVIFMIFLLFRVPIVYFPVVTRKAC
jgi:hypothetical protein